MRHLPTFLATSCSLFAATVLGGCSAPAASFSGTIDAHGYSLDNPVVIAQTLAGTEYSTHVQGDLSFQLTVPVGQTYRFTLANSTRSGVYRLISNIDVTTDAGPSRYVEVTDAGPIELGAVSPIDWNATSTVSGLGALSKPADPGAQATNGHEAESDDDGKPDDVQACDPGVVVESATTKKLAKGARGVGSSAQALGGGEVKVTVCHIPPGNPANAHEITIGAPGVPAHLAHGDYLGACLPSANTPPPSNECPPDGQPGVDGGSAGGGGADGGTTVSSDGGSSGTTDPTPPLPTKNPPGTCAVNADCGQGNICLNGACEVVVL